MHPEDLPPQALEALRAGDRVEAVKQVRMATGQSVAEANAAIDAYERAGAAGLPPVTRAERAVKTPQPVEKRRRETPHLPAEAIARARGLSPGEVPRLGGGGGKWLLLALAAGIVITLVIHGY